MVHLYKVKHDFGVNILGEFASNWVKLCVLNHSHVPGRPREDLAQLPLAMDGWHT